ncbi:hypothetical protein ACHAXT_001387 [Thalassiosira profunda]
MRQRQRAPFASTDGGSSDESDAEEGITAAHPQEAAFRGVSLGDEIPRIDCSVCHILKQLQIGKAWWAQFLTIYLAAVLTYSFNNVGSSTNVQIAIMTVIALFGATPFVSTHIIPAAIGAFVGGQNIIGSTGLLEEHPNIRGRNYLWLLLLSVVVGFVWCFGITRWKILDGYAGRLGTTTFIGMNLAMAIAYGPAGVVDWDRYYYGFVHIVHVGEEDSSPSLSSAWKWTEEAEAAVVYALSVLWLGVVAGGTRTAHNNYIQRCKEESSTGKQPPAPLNNVLVPCLLALFSMLVLNATQYRHATACYNGFAVGCYIAMASLQKIPSGWKFASASTLAALWGLVLTPFFVGFAGKSGFTSMLGHATNSLLESVFHRFQAIRARRREDIRRQLEQLQLEMQEQQIQSTMSQKAKESPPHHHHKPKKDTYYTAQQRRQQRKLKHLHSEGGTNEEQQSLQEPPKLHHRAWSALPAEGDGAWHHSLEESQQELNSVV